MATLSPLYPHHGIDLGRYINVLPKGGDLPFLPSWRWVHTPGHTPGHIAVFHEADRVLIAGDAFTTVKQESAMAVLTQEQEIHGPPAYFTMDWVKARDSIRILEDLNPRVVISGHGQPMGGEELSR